MLAQSRSRASAFIIAVNAVAISGQDALAAAAG
jgi:hypothetical protein